MTLAARIEYGHAGAPLAGSNEIFRSITCFGDENFTVFGGW